jgi:WD40 repeat protein
MVALPGGRLAFADRSIKVVSVWDAVRGEPLGELRGHSGDVNCLAALPNGLLATGSDDRTVKVQQ